MNETRQSCFKPRMLEHFWNSWSSLRLALNHVFYKTSDVGTYFVKHSAVAIFKKYLNWVIRPDQKLIGDLTEGPDVCGDAVPHLCLNFRSKLPIKMPVYNVDRLLHWSTFKTRACGEVEIVYLDTHFVLRVLWYLDCFNSQVTVHNVLIVEGFYTLCNQFYYRRNICLLKWLPVAWRDKIWQRCSICIRHEIACVLILEVVHEINNRF